MSDVNEAPVVTAQVETMDEDAADPFTADLLSAAFVSDPDASDTLTVNTLARTDGGRALASLQLDAGSAEVSFDPNEFNDLAVGESEVLTFSYNVNDGTVDAAQTLSVTVEGRNDAPVAVADSGFVTPEDTATTITAASLLTNDSDVDGGTLSISGVDGAQGGTVVLNPDGSVTYTPAGGFNGEDSFGYTVSDGNGGTDTATVTVAVAEFITGTNGVDVIDVSGDSTLHNIEGLSGRDTITGGSGNDTISGGGNRDTITGSAGDDTISGGASNDDLFGGEGDDQLIGGNGDDNFGYTAIADGTTVGVNGTVANLGITADTILDFDTADDRLRFLSSEFDPLGTLGFRTLIDGTNFSAIGVAYDGANGTSTEFFTGNSSFVFDSTGSLYYDANGANAGYTLIADVQGDTVVANDVEIVATV